MPAESQLTAGVAFNHRCTFFLSGEGKHGGDIDLMATAWMLFTQLEMLGIGWPVIQKSGSLYEQRQAHRTSHEARNYQPKYLQNQYKQWHRYWLRLVSWEPHFRFVSSYCMSTYRLQKACTSSWKKIVFVLSDQYQTLQHRKPTPRAAILNKTTSDVRLINMSRVENYSPAVAYYRWLTNKLAGGVATGERESGTTWIGGS